MRVAYRARLTKSLNSVQMDAIHPRSQIRLPKLDGTEPGTPSHRYHPRPTDLTRMIVNWVCRKPSAGSEIRLAYRESMIALSIIKSRSCGSKLNSVRLIILRPGVLVVPVVLVGLEAKPEDGQIRLPKLDSRYPAPVPRPTGTTLDQLISLE